jgi:hypothetical protein
VRIGRAGRHVEVWLARMWIGPLTQRDIHYCKSFSFL